MNTPKLPSHYLPRELADMTLAPKTLRAIAKNLTAQGITGINVALALDLLTREATPRKEETK